MKLTDVAEPQKSERAWQNLSTLLLRTCGRVSSEPVDLLGAGRPINDDLHASAGGSRRDPGVDLELSLSGEPDGSS